MPAVSRTRLDVFIRGSETRTNSEVTNPTSLSFWYSDRTNIKRMIRQLRDYANQISEYEQLLNSLHPKLDPQDVQTIQDTLAKVGPLTNLPDSSPSLKVV